MEQITARQKEIVTAALGIISDRGLEAMTIKNIAEQVGFSDAAVYRHFQSKEQILNTVIDLFASSSAHLLKEIHACGCADMDKIKLFFLDRCRVFSADRVLATIMFAENLFQNDPRMAAKIHEVLRSHRRLLVAVIRNGQRQKTISAIPADHLFTMVMGSLRLLVLQWQVSGYGFDLMRAGKKLWRSLETLLKKPQGGRHEKKDNHH
jgi:AcrR family transcriptional regulator